MGELIPFPPRPTEPRLDKAAMARVKNRSTRWVEVCVAEGMPSEMRGAKRYFLLSECDPWLASRRSQRSA